MRRWLVAASLLLAGCAPAVQAATPECIRWTAEARYRPYGYDHVVHIENGCHRAASCTVSTNVNPSRQRVTVGAGGHAEVVTFVGSPARSFEARVECELER
jgi:hypothetical protein